MIGQILIVILIGIFAFIPILGWGYIFSYIDNSPLNSRRFIAGIIAGAFSVIPVLYLEDILKYISSPSFNIFTLISDKSSNYFLIGTSIVLITFVIAIFLLITGLMFLNDFVKTIKIYTKNIIIICTFSLVFLLVYFISGYLPFLGKIISNPVTVGSHIFNTLGLILLYYIIIGFIEEASKHFSFLQSSISEINSIKKGILLVIFVALGFGFIENILYLYSIYSQKGSFGGEFLVTLIFRGIFSLFVHILCSVVVGFYFIQAFLNYQKNFLNIPYIKTFLYGLLFSIILHGIFDISLTVNFTIIIFIYAIFGYLYMTRIFYKE